MESLFYFRNDSHHICELKFLDVPETAPKSEIYQWVHVQVRNPEENSTLTKLQFCEMGKLEDGRGFRRFKQGILIFGDDVAHFNDVQDLKNEKQCPTVILDLFKKLLKR